MPSPWNPQIVNSFTHSPPGKEWSVSPSVEHPITRISHPESPVFSPGISDLSPKIAAGDQVTVIGRGIIATVLAYKLMRVGCRLRIIGPAEDAMSGTAAALGISCVKGWDNPDTEFKTEVFRWKVAAHKSLPDWIQTLEQQTGRRIPHSFSGIYQPFADAEQFRAIRRRVFRGAGIGARGAELKGNGDVPEGLKKVLCNRVRGSFFYPRDGWYCPQTMVAVIEDELRKSGHEIITDRVMAIVPRAEPTSSRRVGAPLSWSPWSSWSSWNLVLKNSRVPLPASHLIVAAGVGTVDLVKPLGHDPGSATVTPGHSYVADIGKGSGGRGYETAAAVLGKGGALVIADQHLVLSGGTAPASADLTSRFLLAGELTSRSGARLRFSQQRPWIRSLRCGARALWVCSGFHKSGAQMAHLVADAMIERGLQP